MFLKARKLPFEMPLVFGHVCDLLFFYNNKQLKEHPQGLVIPSFLPGVVDEDMHPFVIHTLLCKLILLVFQDDMQQTRWLFDNQTVKIHKCLMSMLPSNRVLWIYIADGNWVYPFLGLLNPVGFILFLLSSNILAALVYIAGDTLNYLVWAGEARHKKMKS